MKTLQPRTLYVDLDNPQHAWLYENMTFHAGKSPGGFVTVHINGATSSTNFEEHYLEPGENFQARLLDALPQNLAAVWAPGDTPNVPLHRQPGDQIWHSAI